MKPSRVAVAVARRRRKKADVGRFIHPRGPRSKWTVVRNVLHPVLTPPLSLPGIADSATYSCRTWRGTSSLLWEQLTQSRRGSPPSPPRAARRSREAWECLTFRDRITQWQRSRRALVAANEAVAHRARAGRPLHLHCSALLHRATRQTFVAAHNRRRLRARASPG